MRLYKRHDPEQRNGEQPIERIESLPKKRRSEGPMQHIGVPNGWINGWLRNDRVDPPDVPNIHEPVTSIGEKICVEISNKGIGEKAEKKEIHPSWD